MIIYRLVQSDYKDDLTGYGAFLYGGRWNSKGLYALYGATHISLAALEIIVNYDRSIYKIRPSYHLIEIEIPEKSPTIQINVNVLKEKWMNDLDYSRYMGDQFLQQRSHLLLKMPSAVIPEEFNVMLNPMHKDYAHIHIMQPRLYGLDNRLF